MDKFRFSGESHIGGKKRRQFYAFAATRDSACDIYSKRRIIVVTKLKKVISTDFRSKTLKTCCYLPRARKGDKSIVEERLHTLMSQTVPRMLSSKGVWKTFNWVLKAIKRNSTSQSLTQHAEYDESNTYVLERFNTTAGNPVKKILLKLNLSDHRKLKDGGEAEKAHRRGQEFNWETDTYGKVRISLDEFDDEDYICIYDKSSFSYKLFFINDLKTDSGNDNDKVNIELPLDDASIKPSDGIINDNVNTNSHEFNEDVETNHDTPIITKMPPKKTSTFETPAITLDAIRQLIADLTTAMEAQTTAIATYGIDQANQITGPEFKKASDEQELAFLCPNMVPNSEKLMEAFIGGLPQSIEGNVTASKPQILEEATNIAHKLMDQIIKHNFVQETNDHK
ncbi:hypothetical protein Tco_0970151 [Tanacetum coccineum]